MDGEIMKIHWMKDVSGAEIGHWHTLRFTLVQLQYGTFRVFMYDAGDSILKHLPFTQPVTPFKSKGDAKEDAQLWVDAIIKEMKKILS
jgi:hypothetical protein